MYSYGMTNQEIYDAIQRILGQSISDVEKAAQIKTLRDSQFKDDEYLAMLTGYSLAEVKAFLALVDIANEPVYIPIGTPVPVNITVEWPEGANAFYPPPNPDTRDAATWSAMLDWDVLPGDFVIGFVGDLVFNNTYEMRVKSWFTNRYQWNVAYEIDAILRDAARSGTSPIAALDVINRKHNNFAIKYIDAIGMGYDIRKMYGDSRYGQAEGAPQPWSTAFRELRNVPLKPISPANQPPLSPSDVKSGVTTPIRPTTPTPVTVTPGTPATPTPVTVTPGTPATPTPVTVTPGTPATPTPAAGSNIGLLIGAAALALLLG